MKRLRRDAFSYSNTTTASKRKRSFVPLLEQLEERAMLVADLQGQALTAPNAASWGSTISVQSQVRNTGTPGTNGFQVRWYLSQDATGSANDILLNRASNQGVSFTHPGIAAASSGPNFGVNLLLPTAPPVGFAGTSFYIIMRTDAASQIVESNENNNFGQLGDGIDREAITITSPEITTLFGTQNILDGDASPSPGEGSAFGTVARFSAPVPRIFTVRNDGNGPLTLGPISLPTGFTLVEGLSASLAAGASDTFTVQLDTAVAGVKSGQLSIANNDANENPFNFTITGTVVAAPEVTVLFGTNDIQDGITATSATLGTNFGEAPLGSATVSRTFTVRNDGSATLSLGTVLVPGGFTLTEGLVTSLAPGASDNFTVRLNTTTPGLKAGQVRFATNDANENPFDFMIAGVVTVPEVTVEFGLIGIQDGDTTPDIGDGTDFGTAVFGQPGVSHTFSVYNDGAAPLTLGAVSVPTGFTLTEGLVTSLAPGAGDTFTVRLDTAVLGTKTGQVSFATNDLDENPFNFTITGTVIPAIAEIVVTFGAENIADGDNTPSAVDGTNFGAASQGNPPVSRTFTVSNTGNSPLTPGAISLPTGFVLAEGLDASIAAGASDTFTVELETLALGAKSGQISFSTNDTDENPFNFSIAGSVASSVWVAVGPGPSLNGQTENVSPGNEVSGAIHTVLADPTNADILYIGAVNGGVWKTTNATAASPTWVPLTDSFPSLSIGALEFDSNDATYQTVIAGIGRASSFARRGGDHVGLLRSTDGGATWTPLGTANLTGRNISGIVAQGSTIVVSASFNGGGTNPGLYLSTDDGASFTLVSGTNGLGTGEAFDLVADPTNLSRLYVSVGGVGIFRSDDTGASWVNVSSGDAALNTAITTAGNTNLEMAISPTTGRVYAGVVRNGRAVYIGYSDDQGTNWTQMDLPVSQESNGDNEGLNPTEKPGGQGNLHFSIRVDPNDANTIYVGGDRQDSPFPNAIGAVNFTGRLFRGDTTVTAVAPGSTTNIYSPQWEHLTHTQDQGFAGGGTANNSAPHADSREMVFDANGDLIEVDDGGIYRRTSPQTNTGDWFSINGNLQVTEAHDVAYDTNANIIITGNQDTGTTEQTSSGSSTFNSVSTADGGDVVVDNLVGGGNSLRYSSFQNLGSFRLRTVNAANVTINTAFPALNPGSDPIPTKQFVTPLAVNEGQANRLIIGAANGVYESLNGGSNIARISTSAVNSFDGAPIAYGTTGNPEALYVGSGASVLVRTVAAGALSATSPGGGAIRDVEMDPSDFNRALAVDSDQVFFTINTGANWSDITGNLFSAFGINDLHAVEYVEGSGVDFVVVGTERGVYYSTTDNLGAWTVLGSGLANAPVWDLDYDAADDVLVAGTLGRGAWIISAVSATYGAPVAPAAPAALAEAPAGEVIASDAAFGLLPSDAPTFAPPKLFAAGARPVAVGQFPLLAETVADWASEIASMRQRSSSIFAAHQASEAVDEVLRDWASDVAVLL